MALSLHSQNGFTNVLERSVTGSPLDQNHVSRRSVGRPAVRSSCLPLQALHLSNTHRTPPSYKLMERPKHKVQYPHKESPQKPDALRRGQKAGTQRGERSKRQKCSDKGCGRQPKTRWQGRKPYQQPWPSSRTHKPGECTPDWGSVPVTEDSGISPRAHCGDGRETLSRRGTTKEAGNRRRCHCLGPLDPLRRIALGTTSVS